MKCLFVYVKERQHRERNTKGKPFEKHFLMILRNTVLKFNKVS